MRTWRPKADSAITRSGTDGRATVSCRLAMDSTAASQSVDTCSAVTNSR